MSAVQQHLFEDLCEATEKPFDDEMKGDTGRIITIASSRFIVVAEHRPAENDYDFAEEKAEISLASSKTFHALPEARSLDEEKNSTKPYIKDDSATTRASSNQIHDHHLTPSLDVASIVESDSDDPMAEERLLFAKILQQSVDDAMKGRSIKMRADAILWLERDQLARIYAELAGRSPEWPAQQAWRCYQAKPSLYDDVEKRLRQTSARQHAVPEQPSMV